jgi:hemolysin-activating ACP:hemolysin acyltransferase
MTNLVSAFIKAAQSFFVQIRNLEASYSEEMSEVAHAYLTNLNAATVPVVPELKQVFPHLYICKFCIYCQNTGVVYFHFWAKTTHIS